VRPNPDIMKAIHEVHEALAHTWNPKRPALRLPGWPSDVGRAASLIEQLEPDPQVCPHLVGIVLHPEAEVRQAVARFITRSMPLLPPGDLPKFESVLRSIASWRWESSTPTPANLDALGWDVHVLGLYSMHPSGYVREGAVKALAAKCPDGLQYLLLRTNDWVPAVRALAASAVQSQLTQQNARQWADLLPLVTRLQGRSRADPRWVLDGIERILLAPENNELLIEAMEMPDRRGARAAFLMALKLPPPQRSKPLRRAASSRDPVIRLQAARTIRSWLDCPNRSDFLLQLAKDKSGPVRLEVLYSQVEPPTPDRREWIESALLDRFGSIREVARFYYKRLPPPNDPGAFYASVLARANPRPQTTAAATRGLNETGGSHRH
jgi:hypothetical protein